MKEPLQYIKKDEEGNYVFRKATISEVIYLIRFKNSNILKPLIVKGFKTTSYLPFLLVF